jgi:hypothetical protein
VTVTNWLGTTDTAHFYIFFINAIIPEVSLRGAKSITVDPLSSTEIAINVKLPPRAPQGDYFSYFWHQTLGIGNSPRDFGWDDISRWEVNTDILSLGTAVTRKNLVISEGEMLYDTYYSFQLSVRAGTFENNFNFVGIKTQIRPMPEAVFFAKEQHISMNQAVDISALEYFQWANIREANDWWQDETLDADNEIEAIEFLYNVSWTCNEIFSDSILRGCDPDPLEIQPNGTLTLSFTREESLFYFSNKVGRKYRFDVTLSDGYARSVTNNVDYIITTRKYPSVTISPSTLVLSAGEMTQMTVYAVSYGATTPRGLVADSLPADVILERYSLTWGTTEDSLPLYENNGALTRFSTSVALDSNAEGFALGASYSIMVTVIPKGEWAYEGKVSSYATVRMNTPPSNGICLMDSYEGTAFDTDFTVSCSNWADEDVPLKYSFQLVTIDNSTGEEISSTPLINLSDLPYYSFSCGPGFFKVNVSIVDSQDALTTAATEVFIVQLTSEDVESIENYPAAWLTNFTEEKIDSVISAAETGDLSKVAGFIASLSSTIDLIRAQQNQTNELATATETSRTIMSKLLDRLLDGLVPTLDTLETLTTILKTVLREIKELGPDAVGIASGTAGKIVETMISLLSGSYISSFPLKFVHDLSESLTNMMVKGADLGLANELAALYDAAQITLLESLTDTLPGQNGFYVENNKSKIKSQRKSPDEISEVSTDWAALPELTALNDSSSTDVVMRADTFDIYTNTSSVGDVVTVNLFNSTLQTSFKGRREQMRRRQEQMRERPEQIQINEMNECEPILLVIQTTAFADPSSLIAAGGATANDTEVLFPECLSIPTTDPSSAGGGAIWNSSGCTVVAWTSTTATCSCSHLSAFGADLSSFIPDFSCFTDSGISKVDLVSLSRNYMVVIASFTLLFILIRLMPHLEKRASDKHLLAHQFIWSERRDLLVKDSALFITHKAKTHPYFCSRFGLLYRSKLRNSHPVFSICLRNTGTNFTSHQRFICVMSSLATCLAINAIFYGFTFETPASETTTTLVVMLIARIIPFIGKQWFMRHKLTIHTRAKQMRMDEYNEWRTCFKYWIGCYFLFCPFRTWINKTSDESNRYNKAKSEPASARLEGDKDICRNEQNELAIGGLIRSFTKSLEGAFSVHNHEDAYGFKDEIGERKLNRTVTLDFDKNPFKNLQETFNFFDADNNGHISKREFTEAMIRLGENTVPEKVDDVVDKMDLDGDGMITFSEFARSMSHIHFEEGCAKVNRDTPNPPHPTQKDRDLIMSEIAARSKALPTAVETTAGERDQGHSNVENINFRSDLKNYSNTAAGEGEECHDLEGTKMGPGTTVETETRRNLLAVSNEDHSKWNSINDVTKPSVLTERHQSKLENKECVAHTCSGTIELENLEKGAQSREADCKLNMEGRFVSKQESEPENKHAKESKKRDSDGSDSVFKNNKIEEVKVTIESDVISERSSSVDFEDDHPLTDVQKKHLVEIKTKEEAITGKQEEMWRKKDWQSNKKEHVEEPSKEKEISSEGQEIDRTACEKNMQNKNFEIEQNWEHVASGGDVQHEMLFQEDHQNSLPFEETSQDGSLTPDSVPSTTNDDYKQKEKEGNKWITYYGVNSMSKAIASTGNVNTQYVRKSSFMLEDSDFCISNRIANLVGVASARNPRKVKNWELKILVEFQQLLLAKRFMIPKAMLRLAWCSFLIWVIFMIGVILLFGVNMDSDAEVKPDLNIVAAGTSFCPVREITKNGSALNVDVSADAAFNLEGAQLKADTENDNFKRYGDIFPEWLTPPDLLPLHAPESLRFLISSVTSWALGTVVLPILYNTITSFALALLHRNERKRLRNLMDQGTYLKHADIMDFSFADKTFFICCWPAALIEILSEKSKMGDSQKINNLSMVEKILDGITKIIGYE